MGYDNGGMIERENEYNPRLRNNELHDKVKSLKARTKELESQLQRISVDEKLPEVDQRALLERIEIEIHKLLG